MKNNEEIIQKSSVLQFLTCDILFLWKRNILFFDRRSYGAGQRHNNLKSLSLKNSPDTGLQVIGICIQSGQKGIAFVTKVFSPFK